MIVLGLDGKFVRVVIEGRLCRLKYSFGKKRSIKSTNAPYALLKHEGPGSSYDAGCGIPMYDLDDLLSGEVDLPNDQIRRMLRGFVIGLPCFGWHFRHDESLIDIVDVAYKAICNWMSETQKLEAVGRMKVAVFSNVNENWVKVHPETVRAKVAKSLLDKGFVPNVAYPLLKEVVGAEAGTKAYELEFGMERVTFETPRIDEFFHLCTVDEAMKMGAK